MVWAILILLPLLAVWLPGTARAQDQGTAATHCQEVLRAFDRSPLSVTIETEDHGWDESTAVRIDWKSEKDGWIICYFLPRHSESDAWQIQQLDTSRYGTMSRYDMQQLYKLEHLEDLIPEETEPKTPPTPQAKAFYFLQQGINAISLGCVYALIALGFTLVYGITRAINFAFGEVYMMGAYFILLTNAAVLYVLGQTGTGVLLLIFCFGLAISATYGWAMERTVFRPLRNAPSTVPLIAAIGLSIILK